jgi:hypothetical protein
VPWADVTRVKEIGGLNHADDYLSFRFATVAELNTAINNAIAVASAWLNVRLAPGIYTTTDTDIQELLSQGEAYLALHFLIPAVKARKVIGTHFAWESEDSDRYAELIDVEWLALAQELLADWIIIPVGDTHFARPRMRVGTVIDTLAEGFPTAEQEWEEILDRARSLNVGLP